MEKKDIINCETISCSTSIEILEDVRELLQHEKCKDSECISLYDVYCVVAQQMNRYINLENDLVGYIENEMHDDFSIGMQPYHVERIDYNNRRLIIERDGDKVIFVKKDNDIFVEGATMVNAQTMLMVCGHKISNFIDYCMEYKNLFTQICNNIESVNSEFKINIESDNICLYQNGINSSINDFELIISTVFNSYDYYCSSNDVIEIFKNNEKDIMKRIFIKIEDCPRWTHDILYEIRHSQLKNQVSKEKKLEFVRKVLPFGKK